MKFYFSGVNERFISFYLSKMDNVDLLKLTFYGNVYYKLIVDERILLE